MNRNKRTVLIFCLFLLLPLLALPVHAAAPIDTNQQLHLSLYCRDGDLPLTNMEFSLYPIARMDTLGNLTPDEPYEKFDLPLSDHTDAWNDLANELLSFVLQEQIKPAHTGKSDTDGMLTFPQGEATLERGLYLVSGLHHVQAGTIYSTQPFLLLLPGRDKTTDQWIYDVTASPKFSGQPEETTLRRKVLKIWEDDGFEEERPDQISVHLLQDGQIYDTVTLQAQNGWSYTWEALPAAYHWSIQEVTPENYTATLTQQGNTFLLTNRYHQPPPTTPLPPTLPQTGLLWWPIPMLLVAGLTCLLLGLIRRKTES